MYARNLAIAAGLVSVITATAVYANTTSAQEFVNKAAVANKFEIESSQLALDKAQSDDVKLFARKMVDDHTKTGEQLKELLANEDSKITAPTELDKKHQGLLDKLHASPADTFDKIYVSMQTDAHKEAVELFSNYSERGKKGALKNFATETLPNLRDHLSHVQKLEVK